MPLKCDWFLLGSEHVKACCPLVLGWSYVACLDMLGSLTICISNLFQYGSNFRCIHKWRPLSLNMFPLFISFNRYPPKKWRNVPLKGAIYCRTTFNIPFTSCFVDFPRHTLTIFGHSDVHRFSVMVWKLQLELQNICTLKRSPRTGK